MLGMVEVTLVRGDEESLEDPASNVVVCQFYNVRVSDQTKHAWLPTGGHICYTSMELVAARFVCLRWVLLR